ncbi:MAG: Si-specific NAD(P)(+) transhydrogenase [Deltaproteobacteria bacterium]|nr:Si-specific NAD(P)(+) transhydrogenase [Deltaproteobacteria bacterium]
MTTEEYDFIIIGTGPAGLAAAMTAVKSNKRVLVLEKEGSLGGVCVNTGTFPSKTLREAVLHLTGHLKRKVFEDDYCSTRDAEISMEKLKQRLHNVRSEEHNIINSQLQRNGIDMIRGSAAFLDSNTLSVSQVESDKTIRVRGDRILIATGSHPRNPADIPFDHKVIVDSTSILNIETIPDTLIILGGGVIGSEYATIFAALGVKVTLLDRGERLLKFLDREISEHLIENFPRGNIDYISNCGDFKIERAEDGAQLTLADGTVIPADCLFFALGREANTESLNIEKGCVKLNKYHYIEVNDLYQTSNPHIYAVGDVIGWPSLAATSIIQGRLAALNALKIRAEAFPRIFPFGIYTIPEISYIGITEEEAKEKDYKIVIGRCMYRELPRGQISGESEGMLKMIVHSDTREILGVHILGGGATEIIHIAQMALLHNAKIDIFIDSIFNYPTYSEALKIAALSASNQLSH